jgi:hypothetical protein
MWKEIYSYLLFSAFENWFRKLSIPSPVLKLAAQQVSETFGRGGGTRSNLLKRMYVCDDTSGRTDLGILIAGPSNVLTRTSGRERTQRVISASSTLYVLEHELDPGNTSALTHF